MPRPFTRKPISSLFSLCVKSVLSNLAIYTETLEYLPAHVKEQILKKFLTKCALKSSNSNKTLSVLVHPNLKSINLTSVNVDDGTLELLKVCRGLTTITLRNYGNQNISSTGLTTLFEHTNNLLVLDVSHCLQFNDHVLQCVATHCTNLRELSAEGCDITNDGLMLLVQSNKKMKCLKISQTKVNGDGIAEAVQNKKCHYLQELRLDNCAKVDDEVLKKVIYNCPKIEILTFYNCSITDETTIFQDIMVTCKNLKQLNWTISW